MSRLLSTILFSTIFLFAFSMGRIWAATPQEYSQALGKVQDAINRQSEAIQAQVIASGQSPSLVAQQVLAPIHSVETPGQTPALVDTSQLIATIQAAETLKNTDDKTAALQAISQQIDLLRNALVAVPAPTDAASTEASVKSVLSRPEFGSDPFPPPSLADKLAVWLDKLFHPHTPHPASNLPNANPNVILGILIVIAAGAFAVLVSVLVQAIGRREARSRPLALDEEEAVLVEARDNNSLLALAEQQAKAGDYRRAFRLVYLASLVALDTNGVLHFDRSKTNWEYLRALRASGRGDVYTALTPLTREFDQVWYGFAPTDASQYARALAQYHALQAAPVGAAAH